MYNKKNLGQNFDGNKVLSAIFNKIKFKKNKIQLLPRA